MVNNISSDNNSGRNCPHYRKEKEMRNSNKYINKHKNIYQCDYCDFESDDEKDFTESKGVKLCALCYWEVTRGW